MSVLPDTPGGQAALEEEEAAGAAAGLTPLHTTAVLICNR